MMDMEGVSRMKMTIYTEPYFIVIHEIIGYDKT